jgi:hypothetical protein
VRCEFVGVAAAWLGTHTLSLSLLAVDLMFCWDDLTEDSFILSSHNSVSFVAIYFRLPFTAGLIVRTKCAASRAKMHLLDYVFFSGLLPILGAALVVCCLVAGVVVIDHFFLSPEYPDGVDLIREPPGARRFSVQTRLAYYTDCRALYKEAWTKVSLDFMVPRETLTA